MALVLNGWRRLGVLAVALWIMGVVGLVSKEFISSLDSPSRDTIFVHRELPVGATIVGESAVLPDGTVIHLEMRDPSGRVLAPWEIDWEAQPLPLKVQWRRLGLFVVIIPLAAWLLVELLVVLVSSVFRWVARGFRG